MFSSIHKATDVESQDDILPSFDQSSREVQNGSDTPSERKNVEDAESLQKARRSSVSFRMPRRRDSTSNITATETKGESNIIAEQRRTRLKRSVSNLLSQRISRRITMQQDDGLAYEGGSITRVRLRRNDLNFDKLRRMKGETRPMSRWERWKIWLATTLKSNEKSSPSDQIHIPPFTENSKCVSPKIRKRCHFAFHDVTIWLINTSYTNFFLVQFACYYILIYLFSFLIYACSWAYYQNEAKQCLSQMVTPLADNFKGNLENSFEVSWTTFATVGYGVSSPTATVGCYGMRFICSVEAAVGILYFSFAGAIFFARVSRILSRAPVTFSSTLCIQYDTCQSAGAAASQMPGRAMIHELPTLTPKYPIMEFRIVHNKANFKGWEILDVTLNCMVAVDVSPSVVHESNDLKVLFALEVINEDDDTPRPVSKQTYHKVQLETENHPYFKRVWYCRHILNEQSPLLTKAVRNEIVASGSWPPDRNTPLGVRSALIKFKTMIITFNGTSNITSRSVFIEKRYRYEDIFIGWKFAGLIYLDDSTNGEGYAMVDLSLIHDIRPQTGGGEEPLECSDVSPSVSHHHRLSRHRRIESNLFESCSSDQTVKNVNIPYKMTKNLAGDAASKI